MNNHRVITYVVARAFPRFEFRPWDREDLTEINYKFMFFSLIDFPSSTIKPQPKNFARSLQFIYFFPHKSNPLVNESTS